MLIKVKVKRTNLGSHFLLVQAEVNYYEVAHFIRKAFNSVYALRWFVVGSVNMGS